jgi:hypothetical protein
MKYYHNLFTEKVFYLNGGQLQQSPIQNENAGHFIGRNEEREGRKEE